MVSIIVPVYNAQRYLENCVQSILAQTYRDFQLILVNDGSTDESGNLCDGFASRDSRVTVIHQKNAGVSAARNTGLAVTSGEWVCFVDADDTLLPQMLEQTVGTACQHGVDMVIFDPYVCEGDKISVDSLHFFPESTMVYKKEITPERLRYMAGTVWRVLYSREVLRRNNLKFDSTLPLSEDRIFNIEAMGCCEKLYYLRQPLYRYWINPGSAVRKYRPDMLDVVLNTHHRMEQTLRTYWGETYLPIYERVNLVDGALLCVYNVFSPQSTLSFKEKYAQVKQIVNNLQFWKAYEKLQKRTLLQNLFYQKRVLLLCAIAWLWNKKHKMVG